MYTQREIATAMGFTPEGFSRRKKRDEQLRDALERGYAGARISLRRAQFNKALGTERNDPDKVGIDGDTRMLIHLGKVYLGQREKHALAGADEGEHIRIKLRWAGDLDKEGDGERSET